MVAIRLTADQQIPELARYQRQFFVAGAAGAVVSLAGLFFDPAQFFQSYLTGYLFVLGATLGCLALGMVHQLSGGAWGVVTRRLIGASSRVLPVLTVLFLPIVFGMHHLFHWTHADAVAADEILQKKQLFLNTPFFIARAALYFGVWNAIAYFLNKWSLDQDRTGDPGIPRRMQVLSGGGLVAYGLTMTFASFDWVMSLDPHWYSTIYGFLFIGGQGLTALAAAHRDARVAEPEGAAQHRGRAGALPRPGQPDARLRDAVGVLLVLAVPDHLLGQPARRDHVVHAAAVQRLALHRPGARGVPLRPAVSGAPVPDRQARAADAAQGRDRRPRSSGWWICSG